MDGFQDADLKAATAGDFDATARLLVNCSGSMAKRIAARIQWNPYACFSVEDVLQEVFLDVFRGIDRCQAVNEGAFRAWLNQIADHRLGQMLREQGSKKRGGDLTRVRAADDPLRSSIADFVATLADHRYEVPSDLAARDEAVRAMMQGLHALPQDQQAAIKLHYLDGRSLDSTANEMQRTDGAIRGLLQRAKASLRRSLGNTSRWFLRR